MALTNHGELKTAIAEWLERDDLTSKIPDFIALAEDTIGLTLRVRDMETTEDITISAQSNDLSVLTKTFLEQRRLYLDSAEGGRMEYYPPEDFWIRVASTESGKPKLYTIEGGNLIVGPAPETSRTGKLLYFGKYAALSGDSDTNWIFANARMLYLSASMVEACQYIEDEIGVLKWAARYEDTLEKVHKANRMAKFPAGSLQMRNDMGRAEIQVNQ